MTQQDDGRRPQPTVVQAGPARRAAGRAPARAGPRRRPAGGPASRGAGTPAGARGRVLLAEDNPINRKVAVAMLAGAGYEVDTVVDGAAAVEAAGAASATTRS